MAESTVTPPFRFLAGGFVFVISGPAGAGKGTLVRHLMHHRPECVFSISASTRPARPSERDGVDYQFLTREEFERRRDGGEFLEWAEVHGKLYGTPAKPVEEHVRAGRVVVLDIDVQGGASVRRARPDAVSAFVYPPSLELLRERLASRGTESAEELERRMRNAPGELARYVEYDYLVVNDDLESAAARLLAIFDGERARVRRLRPVPPSLPSEKEPS